MVNIAQKPLRRSKFNFIRTIAPVAADWRMVARHLSQAFMPASRLGAEPWCETGQPALAKDASRPI